MALGCLRASFVMMAESRSTPLQTPGKLYMTIGSEELVATSSKNRSITAGVVAFPK